MVLSPVCHDQLLAEQVDLRFRVERWFQEPNVSGQQVSAVPGLRVHHDLIQVNDSGQLYLRAAHVVRGLDEPLPTDLGDREQRDQEAE